ncbi:ABC transporter ATP-binding protein [Cohnella sp. WQ 127256]|uniref:ABC transporter ATP-binding protein n=1 Tax=Cohnella sp. WQ 127256 TaxID=2938790 RepID=UPI00211929A5|nr:ABC transporter ATP-binding protein [Cohnella sp. WQ 127256]
MDDTIVKVSGVSKSIKGQQIVDNIDLSIASGQVLALCGGNGAGKSTILRMIAGIMQPTHGNIQINGMQWGKDRANFAKQIGYMPDDYQFSNGLTAYEALSFWAALRCVPKQRIVEVLTLVGLEHKKNNKVHTFSKGMRQRLLFAQAILAKPPLLIMDEPTNGLDPFWMNEFVQLVKGIKQEGHAVIFSTHQLQVAEEVADYVIFLNNGVNRGEGTVDNYRMKFGAQALHAAFHEALQ